jgi:cysteinyl-tRNA synthetase
MSKSLGNVYTVADLLERGHTPAAVRHLLISAQYRRELNFTFEGLEGSARAVERLQAVHRRLHDEVVEDPSIEPVGLAEAADKLLRNFEEALDDDLNSSEALAALFGFVRDVNTALDRSQARATADELERARAALASVDDVLGLLELAESGSDADADLAEWVEQMIRERADAREARDWTRADEIRDALTERGVVLEDTAQGTRWKVS